jgi:choline-glycine betaine transporter
MKRGAVMEASGIAVPAKKLKPWVFFPPFLLLAAAIALNFLDGDRFSAALAGVYEWVLATFGWLVSLTAFAVVVVCALIYVSPLGRVVIGGPKAKPLLTRWQLFAIVLTTNIAIGILFWGPVPCPISASRRSAPGSRRTRRRRRPLRCPRFSCIGRGRRMPLPR